jgi:predicted RNase H-like nuclease (RuvC/YqgF family)
MNSGQRTQDLLPDDIEACHQLIATLRSQLDMQANELAVKEKLVQQQSHSVLALKTNNDRLDEKVTELNLKIEKLLQQLYGRRSERRIDDAGQLLLDLGEEASPEVVSALEEAIREAEQIVEGAESLAQRLRRLADGGCWVSGSRGCPAKA